MNGTKSILILGNYKIRVIKTYEMVKAISCVKMTFLSEFSDPSQIAGRSKSLPR